MRDGRKKGISIPIMSVDEERFMAFTGLIQWAQGVIEQSKRVVEATQRLNDVQQWNSYPKPIYLLFCEQHYFVIAAYKFYEHLKWVKKFDIFSNVDFQEIDEMPWPDIKDLRNMREHIVDYFTDYGRDKERWFIETPEFKADASSCVGTIAILIEM
ncbi:MAG TPA: hypothetical protein VIQ31_05000 [Phormidium sp.]